MEADKQIDAAGYARVSTLLGQDPGIQLSGFRQFASARGFGLVAEYVDEGISQRSMNYIFRAA